MKKILSLLLIICTCFIPLNVTAELPPPPPPIEEHETTIPSDNKIDENSSVPLNNSVGLEKQETIIKVPEDFFEKNRAESLKFSLGSEDYFEYNKITYDFNKPGSLEYVTLNVSSEYKGKYGYNNVETHFGKKKNMEISGVEDLILNLADIEAQLYGVDKERFTEDIKKSAEEIKSGNKNSQIEYLKEGMKISSYGYKKDYILGQTFGVSRENSISIEDLREKFNPLFGEINSAEFSRSFVSSDNQVSQYTVYTDFGTESPLVSYILSVTIRNSEDLTNIKSFMEKMPPEIESETDAVVKKASEFFNNPESEKIIADDLYKIVLKYNESFTSNGKPSVSVYFYYTLDEKGELVK